MSELTGINLAMQTPMHADGRIDYARWEELIDTYIDAGVHGLVLGAGTGQHPYLTQQECNRLYELGAGRIDGRCKLICQTSALVLDEIVERSKHAQGLGADALMILLPYLEGPEDDNGLFAFYEAIDAAVDTDIIGYNIPQYTGIGISVDLLKRLNQLEHFEVHQGQRRRPEHAPGIPRHRIQGVERLRSQIRSSVSSPGRRGASGVAQTTCRARACSFSNGSPAVTSPAPWSCGRG